MLDGRTDGGTVLVIDDEDSMREGCRQTLEENGYHTSVAGNGEEGLLLAEKMKPNVALVDLKMTGMSGMDVLTRIRDVDPGIVSIVITGYGTTESAVEAMKLGARDFLCKPFDDGVLLEAVSRGIRQSRGSSPRSPRTGIRTPVAPRRRPAFTAPARVLTTKVLDIQRFHHFVNRLIAAQAVEGVKAKDGAADHFVFGPLGNASELRLDHDVTLLPPKKYLLPPRETLVTFKLGDSPTAVPHVEDSAPMVLIGIHPYDMIAINQLDRVMAEGNPDPNYLARRAALAIIGSDPIHAGEHAFWPAMGCECPEDGFDLWLTNIGDAYVIQVGTERGAALLEKYADARDATEDELIARAVYRKALIGKVRAREIKFNPKELPGLLRRSFDHEIWEENARKCLSCGSCNLVCPTCYCFDVRDRVDITLKGGERYRAWDGCVLEDFAKVATGENFREKRLQRYRHRFFRKGMYLYDKYGHIACVGCGRCASACLPDVADPVKVFNALKEEVVR